MFQIPKWEGDDKSYKISKTSSKTLKRKRQKKPEDNPRTKKKTKLDSQSSKSFLHKNKVHPKSQISSKCEQQIVLEKKKAIKNNVESSVENALATVKTLKKQKLKLSLRERMLDKLKSSRFRYLNEQIYNADGDAAKNLFKKDPDAFKSYHEGYQQQVAKWPLNPVDVIIKRIKQLPNDKIIADMGCGMAKLSQSVPHKVYSFDLVAANKHVTECEMSKVPLENESVDVVVFCLSLMGTNIKDFIFEANRILKIGGVLKIAEVESRFGKVENFVQGVQKFNFKKISQDFSNNLFYFFDFKKVDNCKNKNKLSNIELLPCLYKKR